MVNTFNTIQINFASLQPQNLRAFLTADMDLDSEKMAISGEELLKAQSHIYNHIFNFINSMALKCAVDLEIPDTINRHGSKPMSISELVSSLKLDPSKTDCIYRLMRILIHSGFFREEEEGYVLTNSSRLLIKNNPFNLTPYVVSMLDPVLMNPWRFLSVWFRSENGETKTAFEASKGMTLWEYFGSKAEDSHVFNEAMACGSRLVMSVLLDKYRHVFYGIDSIVDVRGGNGTIGKAIAGAFPEMEIAVFDLPHVVNGLEGNENLKYFGGDMFDEIPSADALFLKGIFHDWSDEDCVKILRNCKEAITRNGKKGKVIVIDMVIDHKNGKGDDKIFETQLFFDMMMMTIAGGKERDEKEWVQLFKNAGCSNFKIFPILGLKSLIEIYP